MAAYERWATLGHFRLNTRTIRAFAAIRVDMAGMLSFLNSMPSSVSHLALHQKHQQDGAAPGNAPWPQSMNVSVQGKTRDRNRDATTSLVILKKRPCFFGAHEQNRPSLRMENE